MSKKIIPEYIEATSVACVQNNKVLLVKRAQSPSKGLWSFPGGKVLPSENLKDAAQREFKEETSLCASDLKEWTVSYPSAEDCKVQYRIHVFSCTQVTGEEEARSDAAELGWYTWEESMNLPLAPGMQQHILNLLRCS
ncbi:NUDIX hydrolase [Pseudovibrio ascidiaceicola]|uniref:NUDIX hydrolase n=1 Tax=Pseudovibrio ascidiaceicola TaxID=285279 RepID=UPI003D361F0F